MTSIQRKTQTIAWVVMIVALLSCIVLVIGTPLLARWYLDNATRPLQVWLQQRAGIVTFQSKGRGTPFLISDLQEVFTRSHITLSSDDAEALLLFYIPERLEVPVSTLQLYGETDIAFVSARTPSFNRSPLPHQIHLEVNASKTLRVSVGGDGRTSILHIQTPQGTFDLEEGAYTLAVDAERTAIAVNRGRARVPDPEGGETIFLTDFQNTEITTAGRGEVRSGRNRDILRNSDFESDLPPYWDVFNRRKQLTGESNGTVTRTTDGERTILRFARDGIGHIECGVAQDINLDIQAILSLNVTALVRIDEQSIPLCGVSGTECPVMIRITYRDAQGGTHEWLQGFYAIAGGEYSEVCTICEGSPKHIQVPQNSWYAYASGDLLPVLKARGGDPTTITDIEVYASGHAFSSALSEVNVLIEE